jgi:hypothetical protein
LSGQKSAKGWRRQGITRKATGLVAARAAKREKMAIFCNSIVWRKPILDDEVRERFEARVAVLEQKLREISGALPPGHFGCCRSSRARSRGRGAVRKARRWRMEVADEFQDKLFVLRINVEKPA